MVKFPKYHAEFQNTMASWEFTLDATYETCVILGHERFPDPEEEEQRRMESIKPTTNNQRTEIHHQNC